MLLPERDLTQVEVETFWGRDRANLGQCGAEKRGVVTYYANRDARIGGQPGAAGE